MAFTNRLLIVAVMFVGFMQLRASEKAVVVNEQDVADVCTALRSEDLELLNKTFKKLTTTEALALLDRHDSVTKKTPRQLYAQSSYAQNGKTAEEFFASYIRRKVPAWFFKEEAADSTPIEP